MTVQFAENTQHNKLEAIGFRLVNLSTPPASPAVGQFYYDTALGYSQEWTGSAWQRAGGNNAGGGGDVTGPASAANGQLAVYSGTTGKIIKSDFTGTGLLKSSSGIPAVATPGTDYVTDSSTNTFTNKTFDANGTGNSVVNIETADFAAGVLNVSTSLASASNTQVPSALAVKTYADNLLAANDAMVLKGGIDASTNPNFPAANAGDTYRITVAGLIGGASGITVQAGDTITCYVDATASGTQAAVGANWAVTQANLDQATTAVQGFTRYATLAEAEAKTVSNAAVTPAGLVNYERQATFDIGDGATTTFTVTHNFNNANVSVDVWTIANGDVWLISPTSRGANSFVLTFPITLALNSVRVKINGS